MPDTIENELAVLERGLTALRVEYERFFTGDLKKPPVQTKKRIEDLFRRLEDVHVDRAADRFRLQNLQSRFSSLTELWEKRLLQREQGKLVPARPAPPPSREEAAPAPGRDAEASASVSRKGRVDLMPIFERFCDARRALGEDVSRLKYERFEELLKKQAAAIRKETGASRLVFEVLTVEGKRPPRRPPGHPERKPMRRFLAAGAAALLLAAGPMAGKDVYKAFLSPEVPHHRAIQEILAQIEAHPDDASLFNDLGCLVAWDGFWRDALRNFETAAKLDPADTRPMFNAGIVYAYKGEWGNAQERVPRGREARAGELGRMVDARLRRGAAGPSAVRRRCLSDVAPDGHVALRREAEPVRRQLPAEGDRPHGDL